MLDLIQHTQAKLSLVYSFFVGDFTLKIIQLQNFRHKIHIRPKFTFDSNVQLYNVKCFYYFVPQQFKTHVFIKLSSSYLFVGRLVHPIQLYEPFQVKCNPIDI